MKLLITGASGFLGGIITQKLGNDHQILALSRNSGEYQVDLEKEIPKFHDSFDLVIHSAGKAHSVPKTEAEKKQFHDVNVIGTENLLKGLEKTRVPKQFVFISSVSVYGQEKGNNINEDWQLKAKDAYGLSKIKTEELVIKWCMKYNVICTILRLPLLVGENPPGNLGVMLRAIEKGYYFNIGGGKARKSMVLAKDIANFIPNVAPVGGIFNLTDGFHPSFDELSSAICKIKKKNNPFNIPLTLARLFGLIGDLLGSRAPINSFKVKKITSDLTFNDSKAREIVNWNPQAVVEYLKNNQI